MTIKPITVYYLINDDNEAIVSTTREDGYSIVNKLTVDLDNAAVWDKIARINDEFRRSPQGELSDEERKYIVVKVFKDSIIDKKSYHPRCIIL